MDRLLVELLANRDRCGGISLIDASGRPICGPFAVAARASDALAAANGNPKRDTLLRFGDTPTGVYTVWGTLTSGKGTRFSKPQFGPYGVIAMEPVSGDAACADAGGRFHFLIMGGDLASNGQLRSTAGSLRLRNADLRVLLTALRTRKNVRCEIVERENLANRGSVFVDRTCKDEDPPRFRGRSAAFRSSDVGRGATIGTAAMAIGLAVSFVVAQDNSARAALTGAGPSREPTTFALPDIAKDHTYVRLAYEAPGLQSAFDKNAFAQYMDTHAAPSAAVRDGDCEQTCLNGLRAAGLDTSGIQEPAKDYGPVLERFGFAVVPTQGYTPEVGDVAVFSGNDAHKNGHVQVWDGTQWVSDFKNPVGKFSPYQSGTPDSTIYRHR